MRWFVGIQWERAPGLCIAELTTAGADIAGYHKGCCTFSPAFSHVRSTTAAANGMQTVTFYNTLCFCVTFIGADTYLQPFGLSHWMYDLWFESYDL